MAAYQSSQPPNELIFRVLIEWGHENADQIREAYHSKGGWEGWMQEEMRFLFNANREDHCYLNNARLAADIILTPNSAGEHAFAAPYVEEECVIIELKCESYFNALSFKNEVAKDINKVNNGVFTPRLARDGCNVYCIALATSHEGCCDMEDLGMELFEMDGLAAPFHLLWYMRRIEEEFDEEFDQSEEDDSDSDVDNRGDDSEELDSEDDEMQDEENPYFRADHTDNPDYDEYY